MKRTKSVRLYNVMFPIWFFYFFPSMWLLILPVNFAVDSLVLMLSARRQKLGDRKGLWKKHILPVWGIGFLSDIIGAVCIFPFFLLVDMNRSLREVFHPVYFPGGTIISIPGVIVAGILIYFLNKKLTFRKSTLDALAIHKLCLHLAIFTAPYTMLIPLYG